MNKTEMMSKIQEIRFELNNANYDNFAHKHPRTTHPQRLTENFVGLLNKLDRLVREASSKFPHAQVDSLFREGKELLDITRRAVRKNDFERGKEVLSEVIKIIEQNLIGEKSSQNPNPVPTNNMQSPMIFVSYEDQQILNEIKAVLGALGKSYPERANFRTTERKQSNSLEAVIPRIDEIHLCTSAIICLPAQNSSDASSNVLAYLDLGACLALFPEKILLIHQGQQIPDNLAGKVKTFKYLGNLGFEDGVELLGKIREIL